MAKKGGAPSLKISAVGHAHLDLAWLWPVRETIPKGARTFATVLELMGRYPEYIYGASQPQLYLWMKEYYPELYQKIKQKVKAGRIEPLGASWVEFDTNIPCGESLVRQILFGKRFFKQEFGPDVIIESVKKAEEGNAIILRLYQSENQTEDILLKCNFSVKKAEETNLMEESLEILAINPESSIRLHFEPFEIKTLKLTIN